MKTFAPFLLLVLLLCVNACQLTTPERANQELQTHAKTYIDTFDMGVKAARGADANKDGKLDLKEAFSGLTSFLQQFLAAQTAQHAPVAAPAPPPAPPAEDPTAKIMSGGALGGVVVSLAKSFQADGKSTAANDKAALAQSHIDDAYDRTHAPIGSVTVVKPG